MDILVISRVSPVPVNDGERLRVFNLVKQVAARHRVTLICRALNEDDHAVMDELGNLCRKIIIIDIPENRPFIRKVWQAIPLLFSATPLSVAAWCFDEIGQAIQDEMGRHHYDLVEINHSLLAGYLDWLPDPDKIVKVVNLHNLEVTRFPRLFRGAVNWRKKIFFGIDALRIRKFEGKALQKFDHALCVSSLELEEIGRRWPEVQATLIANGADLDSIDFREEQPDNQNIIYVSTFAAQQNIEAAMYLIESIWPIIHEARPDARLFLVGKDPSSSMLEHDGKHGITVTGTVASTAPYFRDAAICLVPLKTGGGTRLKILEAMAHGVPVVTTTLGVEGIAAQPDRDVILQDSPEGLANSTLSLLKDIEKRRYIANSARTLVEQGLGWGEIGATLNRLYERLVDEHHQCQ